ncbi:hypothetical protein C8Q76DRAFT_754824 [Earliella scabrosa]|nr:hypothetical protein C8Q76DRAFT_754824 [Earliella scabrosa]
MVSCATGRQFTAPPPPMLVATSQVAPLSAARQAGGLASLFSLLDDTLGALLIGTFVTLMLYGLLVHQTYQYFRLYKTDALVLRLIAFGLFITNTVFSVALIDLCYYFLVQEHSKILALTHNRWSSQSAPLLAGTILLLSQGFYFRRVSTGMAKSLYRRWFQGFIGLLMLCGLGILATDSVKGFMSDNVIQGASLYRYTFPIFFGVTIVIDCALTGALVIILRGQRTQFERTNDVLDALASYAVIATALNTTLTIPPFILVVIQPYNFVWFAITLPLSKVYSCSVLAMLNCRTSLNGAKGGAVVCMTTPMASGHIQHTRRTSV